ncbi:MAG: hypothetical protein NT040_03135 [Bacteroidetes bacterium]|nr:hypothetical protein [Bacteroidota bacterium]
MTSRLIRLRFLQLYRGSGDLGLFRVLLVIVVFLPLTAIFLVQHVAQRPWDAAIPAIVLYITWMIHVTRRDYHFLLAIVPHPRVVFIAEYVLFTVPVAVLLLSAALYVHLLLFLAALVVIASTVPSPAKIASRIVKLWMVPAGMFEWQGGIRKNLVVIVIFYIPGLFGFYHAGLSAASLFLLTMVFISFYSEYEPANMLAACNCRSLRFLVQKVVRHTGCFALFLLPLLLVAFVRDESRLITAGYFLAALNMLAFSILLKYYQYRPGAYSGAHQLLTTLACFISVVLPVALFFMLVNIFLAVVANRNLKSYLNDRN